uniref:Uncharacterized protein n=1 Tax=Anguilla anguilla TaxID=7936 RepID=A0A0E9RJ75_ANGAN
MNHAPTCVLVVHKCRTDLNHTNALIVPMVCESIIALQARGNGD